MQSRNEKLDELHDKLQIAQLLVNWGTWRDAGDFAKLRTCYTDDARMVTSWYDGPAAGFVDISSQARARQPRDHGAMHLIGGTTAEVAGDRATAVTRITLLTRGMVHDRLVDVTVYGRFFDFLLRVNGDWRIQSREPIYDKDFLQVVEPGQTIELDAARLTAQPVGFRHLAYVQSAGGMTITTTIADPDSEQEKSLHAKGRRWLGDEST